MKTYIAFVKKELIEYLRTYKLLIMLCVFVFFGMVGPVTARYLPELLNTLMSGELTAMQLTLPDPSAIDSWDQFFKNISQTAMVVYAVIFSGIICGEIKNGTLVNILTKGMPRPSVVLSKATSLIIIWTFGYILSFLISLGYTEYLFPSNGLENILPSVAFMWAYGIMLTGLMIFGSVLFKSSLINILFLGGLSIVISLVNIIPHVSDYNPTYLISMNRYLILGSSPASDFIIPLLISLAVFIASIMGAVAIFNRKAL